MVNRFLRTAPTRTLLATIAGVVAAIAGGTAIAVAASGGGPAPRPEALATALHGALTAPQVQGFSADITFNNHLIGASELQGSDPLLQGGSGHVWVSNTGELRLELYGNNGDPELVVAHNSWWISDPTLQTVYRGTLPAHAADKRQGARHALPTVAQIQADINRLAQHLSVSGATPTDTNGQPTYTVAVSPKQAGGLIGQLQLAWDSVHGVPLRFAVYRRGESTPTIELVASNVQYGSIDSNVFNLRPPADYRTAAVAMPSGPGSASVLAQRGARKHGEHSQITGVQSVAKQLSFKLAAPGSLAGMSRQSVSLMGRKADAGALLVYGQGLGAIAVIEQPATAQSSQQLQLSHGSGDHQNGVVLPTFSVHGATAQELDTALGTVVRFTSHGVTYTVLGSVRPHVARSAARGL